MIVWRLTRAPFAALDGEGARLAGGRWTPKGFSAVYTAGSLSLALLEVIAHLEIDLEDDPLIPDDYVALKIEIPDELLDLVQVVDELPPLSDRMAFATIGLDWLARGKHLLLKVPSVIVPVEHNWIINPKHPAAASIQTLEVTPFTIDQRLVL